MGRYHTSEIQKSKALLQAVFMSFPDVKSYGDLALMYNLLTVSTTSNTASFEVPFLQVGQQLVAKDAHDLYANYYLAAFYANKGNQPEALRYYQKNIAAPNFDAHCYTAFAKKYVAQSQK